MARRSSALEITGEGWHTGTSARRANSLQRPPDLSEYDKVRISVLVAMSTLTLSAPALASNGGMAVPSPASGGVVYGQAVRKIPARPVLRRFAVEHRRVVLRVD